MIPKTPPDITTPSNIGVTRFDRNLAFNVNDFSIFNEHAALIKDICVYMAVRYNETRDLFEEGKIDPKDFAKKMGYERTNLFRNVDIDADKLPEITNRLDGSKYKVHTKFEYALYLMGSQNIPLSYGGETTDGDKVISFKFIQLLEEYSVIIDKNNFDKRYYTFKPSKKFIYSLANRFVNVKTQLLPKFRKNNTYDLYFYLLALRDTCKIKNEDGRPNFNLLCKLAGITSPNGDSVYLKAKLKNKLTILIDTGAIDMVVTWSKASSSDKFDYQPILHFNNNKIDKNIEEAERKTIFTTNYLRLLEDYFNDYKRESKSKDLDFESWHRNKNLGIKEKALSYIKAQQLVYGKKLSLSSYEILTKFPGVEVYQ